MRSVTACVIATALLAGCRSSARRVTVTDVVTHTVTVPASPAEASIPLDPASGRRALGQLFAHGDCGIAVEQGAVYIQKILTVGVLQMGARSRLARQIATTTARLGSAQGRVVDGLARFGPGDVTRQLFGAAAFELLLTLERRVAADYAELTAALYGVKSNGAGADRAERDVAVLDDDTEAAGAEASVFGLPATVQCRQGR